MNYISQIIDIALREVHILTKNHIYAFCMVVFPLMTMFFFTTFLSEGMPQDMPIGVVDLDNSATSRNLMRRLDAMQSSRVVAHYPSITAARNAVQEGEIYAFLYIPDGLSANMVAGRQPSMSYYYTMTCMTAGSMAMKDMKTITTLVSAGLGQATMRAKGYTPNQIQTFLQPVVIDSHQIANPWGSYNVYLSTALVPGVFMLFMMLLSAYSLGIEIKFDTGKEWLKMADGNIVVAVLGKYLIHFIVFLIMAFIFQFYIYGVLDFPKEGSIFNIVRLCVLQVLASLGFGIFTFGLMPSLRMSMSICSLWAVLSFSMAGSAFPIMGMDAPLQALSWLFPLRHYFMLYQITVFNGFPVIDTWFHLVAMIAFTLLPWLVLSKIKNAMLTYVYIP